MRDIIEYHKPYPLNIYDRKIINNKIDEVLCSGQLTNGENVRKLEDQIQKYYKSDYVICTSSCSQALLICLNETTQKIIQTAAFNWWSDMYVLDFLKKSIFWNDIDIKTWLPIEDEIPWTSLYLHTFGNVGSTGEEDTIFDGSHCFGAKFKDIGLATCISLAPTKLITSCEGGVILTNDEIFHDKVKEMRDKCCRMTEPNAIIGIQTLKYLKEVKEWKKRVYEYYKKMIPGQFQEIPYDSSYNTIGFINTEKLTIPKHIQYKQYYEPLHKGLKNTDFIYDNIIVLPSFYNCNYRQIVEDIQNENEM